MSKQQPEEYDILQLAQTVKPKKQIGKLTKIVTIVVGSGLMVGLFSYGLTQWFKPTDFTNEVALTEDVSRFSPLSWVTPEGELENAYGSWVRTDDSRPYVNDSFGCSILLADLPGASAEAGSDLGDTNLYSEIFNQPENGDVSTVKDMIPVNTGGAIEVLRTQYFNADENKQYVTFYRNTIKNETVYLAIVECENEDNYETIMDSDSIPEDLNIRFEG